MLGWSVNEGAVTSVKAVEISGDGEVYDYMYGSMSEHLLRC